MILSCMDSLISPTRSPNFFASLLLSRKRRAFLRLLIFAARLPIYFQHLNSIVNELNETLRGT